MPEIDVILVGKWAVGYRHPKVGTGKGMTILQFEFDDRGAISLAFPPDDAEKIAKAILAQNANPPPKRSRLS